MAAPTAAPTKRAHSAGEFEDAVTSAPWRSWAGKGCEPVYIEAAVAPPIIGQFATPRVPPQDLFTRGEVDPRYVAR